MSLRNLITRGLPDPAEVEHRSAAEQVLATPLLLPVRLFWNTLLDFKPWWPLLLPSLAILAIRSYQRERQHYVAELAARDLQQAMLPTTLQRT